MCPDSCSAHLCSICASVISPPPCAASSSRPPLPEAHAAVPRSSPAFLEVPEALLGIVILVHVLMHLGIVRVEFRHLLGHKPVHPRASSAPRNATDARALRRSRSGPAPASTARPPPRSPTSTHAGSASLPEGRGPTKSPCSRRPRPSTVGSIPIGDALTPAKG